MRIKKFQKLLEKQDLDASIFLCSAPIHDFNIKYFTGFEQTKFHSFSCLIITREKSILATHKLEYDRAIKEAKANEIINLKEYDNSLTKLFKEKLKGISKVGIIERLFPYRIFKKLPEIRFEDISNIVYQMREIKEKKEIEMIEKSCKIANNGIKVIKENLSTKITEKELSLILQQELIRKGADELSFPTILASGKRSAYIHPYPGASDKKIQKGLGLVDFGVRYNGYCSDITVPFTIGKLSEKQKKIVKTVEQAYNTAIENTKIDVPTWRVHTITENVINKNGFEFKHSLGHGLGLEVHDSPSISPRPDNNDLKGWKETLFKENMIFTIEPGIYEINIGGFRLENDFLMTKKGIKVLTESKPIIL